MPCQVLIKQCPTVQIVKYPKIVKAVYYAHRQKLEIVVKHYQQREIPHFRLLGRPPLYKGNKKNKKNGINYFIKYTTG